MSPRLVPLIAGAAPVVPLHRPILLVGRHPECDVRMELPQISRRHCCLALAYDRLTIRDLGSRNGVRVNGRLVDEARLVPGDEVAIGPLLFRLEDQSAAPILAAGAAAARPSTLPDMPTDPKDPDGDLLPMSDLFPSP